MSRLIRLLSYALPLDRCNTFARQTAIMLTNRAQYDAPKAHEADHHVVPFDGLQTMSLFINLEHQDLEEDTELPEPSTAFLALHSVILRLGMVYMPYSPGDVPTSVNRCLDWRSGCAT